MHAQLVADALGTDPHPALDPLVAVVHEKTTGNPFFVLQLLRSLHESRLLTLEVDGAGAVVPRVDIEAARNLKVWRDST